MVTMLAVLSNKRLNFMHRLGFCLTYLTMTKARQGSVDEFFVEVGKAVSRRFLDL